LVRSIERWEPRSAPRLAAGKEDDGDGEQRPSEALDRLAEYAKSPSPSTTLVLVANKLDARRRLATLARKEGFLVLCEPLARQELPGFVERSISERGSRVAPGVADLIAELAGPELAAVADAVERVTLFVAAGGEVTEDAVAECIVRLRPTTVWELVGAVGRRDVGAALRALHGVYDPQDRGLRLVGLLAWSTRQLLRFEAASRAGLPPPEAAKRAGAPPFKARELADQVRRFPRADLERWLEVLAGLDLALKGGSKRPPQAVLEHAIIALSENRRERPRTAGMAKRSTPA
jgi:DNA polymerase-3 subunit delta